MFNATKIVNPTILGLLGAVGVIGCQPNDTTEMRGEMVDDGPRRADLQIARGVEAFSQSCAKCHGPDAKGTDRAPALVGEEALARFDTAIGVAAFVTENMPKDDPGSLPDEDYWAVLAFALDANGVELDEPVGEGNAASIALGE